MKRFVMLIALLTALAWAGAASAASPGTICSVSTTSIVFGVYDVFAPAPLASTGSATITCDKNAAVTISMSASAVSGMFVPRQMKLTTGADLMAYNIYTDATYAVVLGDGTAGTQTMSASAKKNTPLSVTIFGNIPPLQNLSAGTYADTLTVTILW
ncbi:MAG: hypothetical protein A2X56_06495 [Nitrospirae bacterium GWC2_57_13]|jgi:spore coat protein U-like protein|nr:MAG: hypothetical protein A2X56_06495 [Nitrospirae bacterium GWC2_57_13]HAS54936.1 hypothetical protein [Nitrospiraceae bacterium]